MKRLILVLAILALVCPLFGMKLYLTNTSSSGQAQSDPNASLGGYRSTTELSATSMKNLFDDVSIVEAVLGDTEYRMIDVYNDGTGTAYGVQLYMQTPTSSDSTELNFGYSATNQPHADSWNGEALSNESTAPVSPSMSYSNYTKTSPLSLGTIPAGQSKRVCVRRTVTAGAPWTAHDLGRFGLRWGGVAGAPAEPTKVAYDNFTGSDATALASHTSDSSHTWTKQGGADLVITSNAIRATSAAGFGYYYMSHEPSGADYTVIATVYAGSGKAAPLVAGRCNTSVATCYCVRFEGDTWNLYSVSSGSLTSIGTYTGDNPSTAKTVKLEMIGTAIKFYIDDTERISVTDSSISAAGRAGIASYYNDTGQNYIDAFEVWE